jgi:hypothetical protein
MENEADAIYLELTSPPGEGVEPMGVDTPLVDPEGYPRGDIDVYRARTLRSRFRVLQTDHKVRRQSKDIVLKRITSWFRCNVRSVFLFRCQPDDL